MNYDISRAHFQGTAQRLIHSRFPAEDRQRARRNDKIDPAVNAHLEWQSENWHTYFAATPSSSSSPSWSQTLTWWDSQRWENHQQWRDWRPGRMARPRMVGKRINVNADEEDTHTRTRKLLTNRVFCSCAAYSSLPISVQTLLSLQKDFFSSEFRVQVPQQLPCTRRGVYTEHFTRRTARAHFSRACTHFHQCTCIGSRSLSVSQKSSHL